MTLLDKLSQAHQFDLNWQRQCVQGSIILLTGLTFSLASVLQSDAIVMSATYYSWLPVCGIIILALGLLGYLDAFFAKEQRDFFQNLHVATLDTVIGSLIILSIPETLIRLSLMIAAFLIVRGMIRITLVCTLRLPQKILTSSTGLISIATGLMLWLEWPTADGWFLSLCLSVEIAFRGWAMIMFGVWLKKKPA
jgi:uncharacterized membrane protein HdeD (DUF308 family)